jgi:hypothetical protein
MYSYTLSLTSALDGVGDQIPVPATLPPSPPERTLHPFYRRLGGPHERSGRVQKISHPNGIRSPDHPARCESLYRLRYPRPLSVRQRLVEFGLQGSELTKSVRQLPVQRVKTASKFHSPSPIALVDLHTCPATRSSQLPARLNLWYFIHHINSLIISRSISILPSAILQSFDSS